IDGLARERADVLDAVRRRGASTRGVIARETELGRAVIAQRLSELIAAGLIVDSGLEQSTGGRPPRQLRFQAEAGYVLVADLGATSIDVAASDLSGRLVHHRAEPADIGHGPDAILGRVEALFDALRQEPALRQRSLWGIGVGVPGPVEFATGRPVSPPIMPGWDDYPIRERLGDRYAAPVWIDNDVNVMALGERAEGAAQGYENVIFVKLGTGIGAGLISHGNLHRGARGCAGDVGHIQVVADPALVCRCGKIGCLEAIAGGATLARAAERLAQDGQSPRLADRLAAHGVLTAADLTDAARHGDTASIELLQQSGRLIGKMLATAVNLFNPSLIVIGGGVAGAGDLLMSGIREVVYGRSLPLATRDLLIQQSSLGGRAGVIGAAAMALDELFAYERLSRWLEAGSPAGHPELALV
ncbi:MAG TPA: ROK family transcriptional regulator, partial [Thermomicrobiales bacterium]|nr:ROK family transcriptional regulator [Thermomicrobiales bacterium]